MHSHKARVSRLQLHSPSTRLLDLSCIIVVPTGQGPQIGGFDMPVGSAFSDEHSPFCPLLLVNRYFPHDSKGVCDMVDSKDRCRSRRT